MAFHLYFESKHRDYPNNILRNLALDQVQSDYFALFDVDLLPSPMNTHQHLRSMFDHNPQLEDKLKDKTVFILPVWEIEEKLSDEDITIQHPLYPETKEMVLEMNGGKIRKKENYEYFDMCLNQAIGLRIIPSGNPTIPMYPPNQSRGVRIRAVHHWGDEGCSKVLSGFPGLWVQ